VPGSSLPPHHWHSASDRLGINMHMFGGGGGNAGAGAGAPMMGPPGYGPPADQERGYGQNPGGYGGQPPMGGPPGGYAPVGGPPPPGPGGYGQGPPPGYGQPPGAPGSNLPNPSYRMSSTTSPMHLLWFAAACSVMLGALMSFLSELFSWEWVDALESGYLFLFGCLLAVLHTPLFNQVAIVSDLRSGIFKYIAALQRVTGKGLAYIFVGCALWSSMFANVEGGFLLFFGGLIGLFVVIIGVISVVLAFSKSQSLDKVRQEFRQEPASLKQIYDMHAKMNPAVGLTKEEFKKMTPFARGVSFEQSDIELIFNALSSHPRKEVISLEDLNIWVNGWGQVWI